MQAILLIAGIVAVAAFIHKSNQWQAEEEQELSLFDVAKLDREVQALHSDMMRLRQLDDMIIDNRLAIVQTGRSTKGISDGVDVYGRAESCIGVHGRRQ